MEIPPIYWTILGEIAIVFIGILIAVIVVILKDRGKLKDYTDYLKETIKKLKKKLLDNETETEQSQERIPELLNAVLEHIRAHYQSVYGSEITTANDENATQDAPSVEQFILIAGYQTIIAELSALEKNNDPQVTWEKINNELTPLIQNYLNPILSAQSASTESADNADNLNAQLEQASQRIANLEKFKQLYFDLQDRLTTSVEEIEQLNQQIGDLAEGSDNFADIMAISEQNKAQYINMGQMIGMDIARHHDSVAEKMDYSDELINERKDELKRLKHQIARQFEEIWSLQNTLTTTSDQPPNPDELSAGIETMSHSLKDAQMCIETMDMEIQTLSSEIANLRNKLKQQGSAGSGSDNQLIELEKQVQEKDQLIARFIQESKEMRSCIIGLEESNSEQSNTINQLQDKLKSNEKSIK